MRLKVGKVIPPWHVYRISLTARGMSHRHVSINLII